MGCRGQNRAYRVEFQLAGKSAVKAHPTSENHDLVVARELHLICLDERFDPEALCGSGCFHSRTFLSRNPDAYIYSLFPQTSLTLQGGYTAQSPLQPRYHGEWDGG